MCAAHSSLEVQPPSTAAKGDCTLARSDDLRVLCDIACFLRLWPLFLQSSKPISMVIFCSSIRLVVVRHTVSLLISWLMPTGVVVLWRGVLPYVDRDLQSPLSILIMYVCM